MDIIPNFPIGGWGGWGQAIGSARTFAERGGDRIARYCILDRDYHTDDEIAERKASAIVNSIRLHIWAKKEIENYVIVARTIERHINTHKRKGTIVTVTEVEQKLDALCEGMKEETLDQISQQFNYAHRPKNSSDGNRYARAQLRTRWTSLSGKLGVVGGKNMLARISEWAHLNYGIGINAYSLARSMVAAELDAELVSVMQAIETGAAFTA